MTLRELTSEHPEWADLPIAVELQDGGMRFIAMKCVGVEYNDVGDEVLLFDLS